MANRAIALLHMRVSACRLPELICLAVLCAPSRGMAQDSARTVLAPVRVSVARDVARPVQELPYALSRVAVDTARAMTRRASLTELLYAIPGVSVSHRYNPTQDPRLAIRGFGARSAFGIRGVRVLRDGIPLTLADGQTAVDFLDLETAGAVEVMRGSAGALYGNSSGGVVEIRTPAPPDSGVRARASIFSAGDIVRFSAGAGAATPAGRWQGTFTRNSGTGPRDYSEFENTSGFLDGRWSLGGLQWQGQLTLYDGPRAQNPGAVTATELRETPFVADPQNVTKKASKEARQSLASLAATRVSSRGLWSGAVFGGTRDLKNPQAFAIVEFDRLTWGASTRGEYLLGGGRAPRIGAGIDVLSQRDDRQNYVNCAGLTGAQRTPANCPTAADRGTQTVNQRERVTSVGAYARAEAALASRLSGVATLRHDNAVFSVLDLRSGTAGSNEAQSRTLRATTPMLGLNWRIGALSSAYVNLAESFETPTTTELANQPDGSAGLNRELRPQRGRTIEAGGRGDLGARLRYDVAAYRILTRDELIPFEIPNSGGRRFFRNAGRTRRTGAEGTLSGEAGPLSLGTTASVLRYVYDEYLAGTTSFNGKHVPGVAPVSISVWANARAPWGLAAVELQRASRTAVDDANSAYADAYTMVNIRSGLHWSRRLGLEPVVGIDNLFDTHYASNIVTNATRGRFFEPGPGRTVYVMLRVTGEK